MVVVLTNSEGAFFEPVLVHHRFTWDGLNAFGLVGAALPPTTVI